MIRFWKRNKRAPIPQRHLRKITGQHVKNYREGRHLMRHGDGADEYIGMDIARKARDELRLMGYDIDGTRPDLIRIEAD